MDNQHISQGGGLNLDTVPSKVQEGQLTFALNSLIANFDGNEVAYQNEEANLKCVEFPEGFKVVGVFNITQINKVVYFLTNPTTGDNEIGETNNNDCAYKRVVWGKCLNFSVLHPIHQVVIKTTNCSVQVYWTDNYNAMRYIDLDDLPWKELPDPSNDFKKIKQEGELDCNKLLVQANFTIPKADIVSVEEGGNITTGAYQFVVQYANSLGEGYTSFYNVTNPISITEPDRATPDFNLPTSKSIRVKIKNLDTSGVFDYFNLVVVETVNAISTPKLVGTYPIANEEYDILYTGDTVTNIQISIEELFQKFQHYTIAEGVTQSDDRIIWYNLKQQVKKNYQPLVSKIKVYWETWKIPYTESEGYKNAMNTYLYRGLMRDEVYPIEIVFLLTNGRETEAYATIGRMYQQGEKDSIDNNDSANTKADKCQETTPKERWQVYNTAYVLETYAQHDAGDPCYKGPYQYGEMAYWESEERYPNNIDIWGELAGQPIRHHKLPDELVCPRFSVEEGVEFIYPIGIKIDAGSVYQAIQETLTEEEQKEIVGFKVLRGDRSAGNMSVKAKGHFTNVGKYEYEDQEYYFPNYPYNSLGEDPLFANQEIEANTLYNYDKALQPFKNNEGKDRFVFHSPDTHFGRVASVDSGYVKLEAIDYGEGSVHFVPIKDNAEYKFTTQNVTMVSAALATAVAFDISKGGKPSFNGSDWAQMYTNMEQLLEKLIAYQNFGYNINSTATFNKTFAIPNEGDKIRGINYGKYLADGFNTIDDGKLLNNYRRESSVFIKTYEKFLYAHQYDDAIPEDNSRVIASYQSGGEGVISPEEFFQMARTQNLNSMIALILGIRSVAQDLADGSENLTVIFSQIIAQVLQTFTDADNFQGLEQWMDANEDCLNIGETPAYFFNLAPSTFTSYQNVNVTDYDGTEMFEVVDFSAGPVTNTIPTIFSNELITLTYIEDDIQLTIQESGDAATQVGPQNNLPDPIYLALKGVAGLGIHGTSTYEICGGKILRGVYQAIVQGAKAYRTLGNSVKMEKMSTPRPINVNAYYGALKTEMPAQWGRIYSYETVDTGYYQPLYNEAGIAYNTFPTVWGGDTYINKFSFKTKLPVFNKTTVGKPHGMDIALNEDGNLGYPMFWISTKPLSYDYDLNMSDLQTSLQGIGVTVKSRVIGSLAEAIGSVIMTIGLGISASGVGIVPGLIVTAVGGIIYVLGKIFSNKAAPIEKAAIRLFKSLIEQMIETLGIKNINLDMQRSNTIASTGVIYQYVYGIPSYFVESQVNVDYRQATNDNEGNFYPRVGTGIPDDWLQEARVPIAYDNIYTYNKSFSKQNRENFYTHLREDYDANKVCNTEFPNRAFWSEKTNLNETLNNWLIYKPVSRYDFPKSFGALTSLDGVLNRQVIARFENKTQIYNALTTVNTTTFQAYLGNDKLFSSTPPLDLAETDTGSLGSQHKFLLKTPQGIVFTDAKRGQVILLRGTQPIVISEAGLSKWFGENLQFFIKRQFPEFDTDNHFNGIGLHGVYDEFYNRLLLTKKDYLPLDPNIKYDDKGFYLETEKTVKSSTKEYECPPGYAYDPVTNTCNMNSVIASQSVTSPIYHIVNENYGIFGAWIYNSNYDVVATSTSTFWLASVNRLSKWISQGEGPYDVPVGFSFCIDVPETKEFYLGITGDNIFDIYVDGINVFSTTGDPLTRDFRALHIIPITLTSGEHKISMTVINISGSGTPGQNPGSIAAEIYDNSPSQILAATSTSDLNILFSTENQTSFPQFDNVCPDGYTLIEDSAECGVFYCQKIDSVAPTETVKTIYKTTKTKTYLDLDDKKYFLNKSWTISYSFLTEKWISWHSYLPLFYIPQTEHFQSSLNKGSVWQHGTDYNNYCIFYGIKERHIIEYPFAYKLNDEILQCVSTYSTALKYISPTEYYEPDENIFFNKALVYNRQQNSGYLNLIPKPQNSLRSYMGYPKYNSDSKDILVSKTDNIFSFNDIRDITKVKGGLNILQSDDPTRSNIQLNNANMEYTPRAFNSPMMRAKDSRVRLIAEQTDYKLISHFLIEGTQTSYL